MRRGIVGLRRAQTRPLKAARVVAIGGLAVLLTACAPQESEVAAAEPAVTTAAPTTSSAPATTTPAPTTPAATTPAPVRVPALTGMPVAQAKAALAAAGLRVRTTTVRTARYAAGTVVSQSHEADRRLRRGTVVTLQVAVAPPPAPRPSPTPRRTTPPPPPPAPDPQPACHPSYAGACLDPDASDYDCAGGSGNGPEYTGRVRVVGPDVFDLDRDGDGIGCEDG